MKYFKREAFSTVFVFFVNGKNIQFEKVFYHLLISTCNYTDGGCVLSCHTSQVLPAFTEMANLWMRKHIWSGQRSTREQGPVFLLLLQSCGFCRADPQQELWSFQAAFCWARGRGWKRHMDNTQPIPYARERSQDLWLQAKLQRNLAEASVDQAAVISQENT